MKRSQRMTISVSKSSPRRQFLKHSFLWGCGISLANCQSQSNESMDFAPACPPVKILPEASDYFVFTKNGTDYQTLVAKATMTDLEGDCTKPHDKQSFVIRLAIHMKITSGPANPSKNLLFPWFIAVMHGRRLVSKHIFYHMVTLDNAALPRETTTNITNVTLPAPLRNRMTPYKFLIGFQLSAQQLFYNRQHLPKALWQQD